MSFTNGQWLNHAFELHQNAGDKNWREWLEMNVNGVRGSHARKYMYSE